MIGELEKTVLDCPDPRALASFSCDVLGMQVNQDLGDWTVIGRGPDRAEAALLRVGARRQPTAAETVHGSFRTFLDPAGHPFCIVFGRPPRGASAEGETSAPTGPPA